MYRCAQPVRNLRLLPSHVFHALFSQLIIIPPRRRHVFIEKDAQKTMGSHLGVTLQAGVAARSHRRHEGEYVQDCDNLNSLVRSESRSTHTAKHRKKPSDQSGKSSNSSGTTGESTVSKKLTIFAPSSDDRGSC